MEYKFKISGLDCPKCSNELEEKINKLKEINNLSINFITQVMKFETAQNIEEVLPKIEKIIQKNEPNVQIVRY